MSFVRFLLYFTLFLDLSIFLLGKRDSKIFNYQKKCEKREKRKKIEKNLCS